MSCFSFFSSRRRHTRCSRDWSSDVCSSDLGGGDGVEALRGVARLLEASGRRSDAIGRIGPAEFAVVAAGEPQDRKSTRLNSSHGYISYAVFCLKKKKQNRNTHRQHAPALHVSPV